MAALTLAMTMMFFIPVAAIAGNPQPTAAPGPTMKTLDEIPPSWHQRLPASERFELVMGDAAVLDKETGLVWARNANMFSAQSWNDAQTSCFRAHIGGRKGWRIPTVDELSSLVVLARSNPALPSGHPFFNVQNDLYYWSGTSFAPNNEYGWVANMGDGDVTARYKTNGYYVWPVRGDN